MLDGSIGKRETDRQRKKETDRQTEKERDRQTDRNCCIHTAIAISETDGQSNSLENIEDIFASMSFYRLKLVDVSEIYFF